MLGNVSSLVNIKWYLGIPFNDTNWRFQIAEKGEAILGDKLLGFQASNEPDLYAAYVLLSPRCILFPYATYPDTDTDRRDGGRRTFSTNSVQCLRPTRAIPWSPRRTT